MSGALVLALVLADPSPKNVRPKATVEVLDSTAQVDDVISKLRAKKEVPKQELKQERPPLPSDATPDEDKHKGGRKRGDKRQDRRDHDADRHDRDHHRH